MPYENEEQVIEALREAARQDGHDTSHDARVAAEANPAPASAEQAETPAPEAAETQEQPTEDSFTHIDPASLPDDLQPIYKSLQADHTRKTQQLAEMRKRYEALDEYGGPEMAQEALDWVASLQNPDNALQLHRELTQALTARGYTLDQAQAAATQEVARQQAEEDFSFEPEPDPRVDEMSRKLNELEQWRAEREREDMNLRLAAHYDRQEAEILSGKSFKDDNEREAYLEDVYNLSFAFGGDLVKADQYLGDMRSRALGDYINSKSAVPTGSTIPATSSADIPQGFRDLNDPQLELAVNRFLAEQAAAGE